ncbi:MAG: UDP-N-acetylmuramoyl-L-alanyl-D-glutamate--2,6-diaminopimelate ligase [Polyangiaceae bacterium]|jgi:UDP-N-acetylmuramoyl-L-alanyl-D-glutamate--2,6-diaminopimelate ligase
MTGDARVDPRVGLRLDDLVRALPMSAEVAGDVRVRVTGVKHDSRGVAPGDLFVARMGTRADGAAFAVDAIARGARAVLARRGAVDPVVLGVPAVFVDDPARALAYAASVIYGRPSMALDVVGITGTNGKTTTAYLVQAAVDGALGRPACGILGTIEQRFGEWSVPADRTTPEADDIARTLATMRDRGASYAAMEISSHALALDRVRGIRFRALALTNVTQDHLDFHGSMEAYARTKASLFEEYGPAAAVLNVDDAVGRELASRLQAPLRVSARLGADTDVAVRSSRVDAAGIDALVGTPKGDVTITSRLLGAHNLDNLVLALGIAVAVGLDPGAAGAALSRAPGAPGRLERCDEPGDDIMVLVDYAHTPDALGRVLDAVRGACAGRILCVFGCGGDRDRTKRQPMGEVVGRRADVAIVTSDNPRSEDPSTIADAVARGVSAAAGQLVVELGRADAIELAIRSARPGDAVLIAGKGHETVQVVGAEKRPFDDRVEARRALARRRGM